MSKDYRLKTWRCSCGCPSFLTFGMWFFDDGDGYGYAAVEEFGRELDWWERIKQAIKILRGQETVTTEVVLTKEYVNEMYETIKALKAYTDEL